jgi:hypothetical protein
MVSRIDAVDIAEGKPWVCLGLKSLIVNIGFDPSTSHHIQPLVFDQLSRLRHLQLLRLWDHSYRVPKFQETIDLSLEAGLGKLSTLRALQYLDWGRSTQKMGDQEIGWMLQHWRCLKFIHGKFNYKLGPEEHRQMQEKLWEHGIMVVGFMGVLSSADPRTMSTMEKDWYSAWSNV